MKYAVLGLILLISSKSYAANVSLSVAPEVCVTQVPGSKCDAEYTVTWESSTRLNACLKIDAQLIECWQGKKQAQVHLPLTLTKNHSLTLWDSSVDQEQPLAQVPLQVQTSISQQYRRRLRSPWSLF